VGPGLFCKIMDTISPPKWIRTKTWTKEKKTKKEKVENVKKVKHTYTHTHTHQRFDFLFCFSFLMSVSTLLQKQRALVASIHQKCATMDTRTHLIAEQWIHTSTQLSINGYTHPHNCRTMDKRTHLIAERWIHAPT
jgi:hypothetical protein